MPPSKKKRVADKTQQLHQQSVMVPIGQLKAHPKNPNLGDVAAIAESLAEFGQYRPVVANLRNGQIVAGHHTWLGARKLGWEEVSVVWIDVDEQTHLRIMVADNRLSDLRQTDETLLDQILQSIKGVTVGTGFTELDVEDLHTKISAGLNEAMDSLDAAERDRRQAEIDLRKSKTFDGAEFGDEPDDADEFDDEDLDDDDAGSVGRRREKDGLLDAEESMNNGLVTFSETDDLMFPGIGELELPRIDTDPNKLMTFDDIPDNLIAWAGSATKDWPDEDQWWLYNWGIDSTSGMRDRSKVVVSFYTDDSYFDNWWWYTHRYAAKLVNSGIKYIVTPDYSMESALPRAFAIWQLYRNRYLARYFQEIGMKIVPNVSWKDGDELFLKKYVLGTLPKQLPLIAMQMQTIDMANVDLALYRKHIQLVLDTLEPQGLLLYVGKQTDDVLQSINIPCPVFKVESRMYKLSEQAKRRTKKAGI